MHILLADTIEVCGRSHKFMKLMDQFRIVCSPDIHDRLYVTEIAHIQHTMGLPPSDKLYKQPVLIHWKVMLLSNCIYE